MRGFFVYGNVCFWPNGPAPYFMTCLCGVHATRLKYSHSSADKTCMTVRQDNRDYYEVLHVSRGAPLEIIRGSYRTMMQQLKHHPDLGGDTATAALINEAYAVLSNPERRAEYDAGLNVFAQFSSGEPDETPEAEPTEVKQQKRVLDPTRECLFCETPHDHGKVIQVNAKCATCSSPMFAAENCRIETVGKRAIARVQKRQNITYYTHWPQSKGYRGQTEDVSLHGLRFVTKRNIRQGNRIKIVSNDLDAIATVMHCDHKRGGWRPQCVVGVSFESLRFAKTIGSFLSARA